MLNKGTRLTVVSHFIIQGCIWVFKSSERKKTRDISNTYNCFITFWKKEEMEEIKYLFL